MPLVGAFAAAFVVAGVTSAVATEPLVVLLLVSVVCLPRDLSPLSEGLGVLQGLAGSRSAP